MKRTAKSIVALILTFVLTFQGLLYADLSVDKHEETKKVIVKFKNDTVNLEAVDRDKAFKHVKKINKKGIYIIETDKKSLKKLKQDKNVEYIEEDGIIQKSDDNITWNVDMVKAPVLQNQNYNGQGIKVAVFDTGIDVNNKDILVKGGVSFIEGTRDFTDDNGHGTAVAGIIGAAKNNEGYLGVAPEVELYSVKVLDRDGLGTYSNIIQGIEWAIDNEIDIISMSFGGTQYSKILKEAIGEATKNNILIVAASGNEGNNTIVNYPARFSDVICVGAIDKAGNLATFSNTGEEMDLVAPGIDIETTYLNNSNIKISGTSAAVPHVVGIAAQILNAKKDLTQEQLKALLYNSATPLGEVKLYGWGMVNAIQSLDNINEKIELPEKNDEWADINVIDSGTDGLVKFSYIIYGNNQTITTGSSVEVRAGFYANHSRCIVTTYNSNNPNLILHREERAPIAGNAYMTYTCPAGILNTPGTYKIRYHAQDDHDPSYNADGRWDDVFTIYVVNGTPPPDPDPDPTPVDDHKNNYYQATPVSVGSQVSGTINYAGDLDFFRFTPSRTGYYTIQSSGNTDVKATLYNNSYTDIAESDDEGGYPNFKIVYTLQAGQTYYLGIEAFQNSGSYSFRIIEPATDSSENFDQAVTLPLNSSVARNIDYPGDNDYFKFTTTTAGNYIIESSGTTDTYGELYNYNKVLIKPNDDDGDGSNFLFDEPLLANTTYYLKVRHYFESETGAYSVKVTPPSGKPDLEVTDISWSPANPVDGDEVTFSATIKNNGNAATQAGTSLSVRFTVGSSDVAWSRGNTTSIPAGGTVTLTANGGPYNGKNKWTSVSGTHNVKAYVDDLNAFTESNESNNERSENITVTGLPDLVIDSLAVDPDGLVAGLEEEVLKATVVNRGPGASNGAFDVEFKVMGGYNYQTLVHTLYGSYSGTINAGFDPHIIESNAKWIPTTGKYRIVAKVNYKGNQGGIREKDYNNNTYTLDIDVGSIDYNEPNNNTRNGATIISREVSSKIHEPKDVDWYYYDVNTINKYLHVSIDCPGYLTGTTTDDQNYDLELYDSTGKLLEVTTSSYPTGTLEFISYKVLKTGRYYIKVFAHKDPNRTHSSDLYYYKLDVKGISSEIPYGGEFSGWSYLGYGVDASNTVNFSYGTGMDEIWSSNAKSGITYKELVEGYGTGTSQQQGGLSIWNDANINGAPDEIFNNNGLSINNIYAKEDTKNSYYAYAVSIGNYFHVKLNSHTMNEKSLNGKSGTYATTGGNSNYNMAKAIVAHELGHILGLRDLYVDGSYNYTVNNSNKLMYGYAGKGTHLNMSTYLHTKDIEGARAIQGWGRTASLRNEQKNNEKAIIHASYIDYSDEDLYNKSTIIVRGKIKSIQDYNSSNSDEFYSRVTLETKDYYKDVTGLSNNELVFLQDGNSAAEFAENSLFNIGDEVILFLEKEESGNLIISGGPQGRFDIVDTGSELFVQNHLTKRIEEELIISGTDYFEPEVTPILEFEQQIEEGIQNIAPVITGNALTLPNENNWYKEDVTVHFTAEDTMYGIASISPDITITTEGVDKSATGTATNKAGNKSTYTVNGINIDKTLPTIAAKKSVEQNSDGWYNKPVTIHFEAADALSGIAYVQSDVMVSQEGVNPAITGKAVDKAGNEAIITIDEIKLDTKAPILNAQPNMSEWGNRDISVTPICVDENGSGIKQIQYTWTKQAEQPSTWTGYTAGEISQQADGVWYLNLKAEDYAGNISEVKFGPYRLDKTIPVLDVNPQSKDWSNAIVKVQPSYIDGPGSQIKESYYQWSMSEIPSINWAKYAGGVLEQGSEGIWYLHIKAVDFAGNENVGKFGPYSIDLTKPELSVSLESRDWDNEEIIVQANYTDKGGAGINAVEYSWSTSETQPSLWEKTDTGLMKNSRDGIWYLFIKVNDKAGNEVLTKFGPYKFDKTAPKSTVSPTQRAWNVTDVKVTPSITDANGSGVISTKYSWNKDGENPSQWLDYKGEELSITQEGSWYLHIKAIDKAGNESIEKFGPYMIDRTLPEITVNLSEKDWTNNDIVITPTAIDSLSGINKVDYKLSSSKEIPNDWNLYNGGNVTVTQTGTWYLHIKAADKAGNIKEATFGPYKLDKISPTNDVDIKQSDWVNSDILIKATYEDQGGSGVKEVKYTWGDDKLVSIDWKPYDAAGITQGMDGAWYLYIKVADIAGNETVTKYGTYKVDKLAPEINANPQLMEWTNGNINIIPNILDNHSGVDTIEYQMTMQNTPDNNWLQYGNQALELKDTGVWYLHIRAKDKVNNTKVTTFGPYKIDKIAPTVTAAPENADWSNQNLIIQAVFNDEGGSNVLRKQYTWTEVENSPGAWNDTLSDTIEQSIDGIWYLYIKATDAAGNETTVKFGPYKVDRTKPVITHTLKDDYLYKENLLLHFEAQDNLSGVKETYVKVNGNTYANSTEIILDKPGINNIEFVAIDVAGNIETITKLINVTVIAQIDFEPKSLNLKNADKGNSVVTVYIELPAELNANEILINTIKLNDMISPITDAKQGYVKNPVSDYDNDGIPEFMVKFEKGSLDNMFMSGNNNVIIKGSTGIYNFTGSCIIDVK